MNVTVETQVSELSGSILVVVTLTTDRESFQTSRPIYLSDLRCIGPVKLVEKISEIINECLAAALGSYQRSNR